MINPYFIIPLTYIAIYFLFQIILLIVVNRYYLGDKLKSKEIINIAIIVGLLATLIWIVISLCFAYIIVIIVMFMGISLNYAIVGPIIAGYVTFLIFKKSIDSDVKNISIKKTRNLCVFIILFNISLIFSYIATLSR